jgi:hypothetical protein
MQRARRGVDWGALLALVFGLALAWPFLLQPGLPRTNGSENYVYRVADYARGLQEGHLYPRWSPVALDGYGAPIPNFAPPGAPYLAALVQIVATGNPVDAVRLVYAGALSLAGAAVYALVTRRVGAAFGMVATTLYLCSPYVGLTAPHLLGDLPGVAGMALLPALLWSADRMLAGNRPPNLLLVVLTAAALLLTDPRAAAAGLALTAALALWHRLTTGSRFPWRLGAGLALGVGAASFYWIPAVLEYYDARWILPQRGVIHVVTLPDLLLPPRPLDLGELVPAPRLTLGLGTVLAALVGAGALWWLRKNKAAVEAPHDSPLPAHPLIVGFQALFLGLGAVGVALALLLPTQPWLLAPLSLCFAIGGSAALWPLLRLPNSARRLALPVALLSILWLGLPTWLPPRWNPDFGGWSARDQLAYERQGYGVAVLAPGEGAPTLLNRALQPSPFLISGIEAGEANRIAPSQPGAGAQYAVLETTSHGGRYQITTSEPLSLSLLTSYFPGWAATFRGAPVPVGRDPQTGLTRVSLPRSTGAEMVVTFGTTDVRTGAWIISTACVGIVLVATIGRVRRAQPYFDDLDLLTLPEARLTGALLGVFALIVMLFVAAPTPLLYARPGHALDNTVALRARTDVGLEALSFRLDNTSYRPGEAVTFALYWRALRFLPANYRARAFLFPMGGSASIASAAPRHPGGYPTGRWTPNPYISDPYILTLPRSTPPGDYLIGVEIDACTPACPSRSRVTFFDAGGGALGQVLILPAVVQVR